MKGKLLLSLTIASLISANAFAHNIHKGKITKHKEWSTGSIHGVFKDVKANSFELKMPTIEKSKNGATAFIVSFANAPTFTGIVGVATPIHSEHMTQFSNDTGSTQVFYYTIGTCLDTSHYMKECTYSYDEVTLEPNGSADMWTLVDASTTYDKPDSYEITSQTVSGVVSEEDGFDHVQTESVSYSTSKVVITANKR